MALSNDEIQEMVEEASEKSTERNFTQTFDLSVSIKDLDLSNPDNRINEDVKLPNGTGKEQKVAIFAEGELAEKAREAGADSVFSKDELEELGDDKSRAKNIADDHGYFLAQSDLMPIVGKELGPVLGPRGKMPDAIPPTEDPEDKIEGSRSRVQVSMRENPVINLPVGTEEMDNDDITENVNDVLDFIVSELPKGPRQIKRITVKTTMGEPVSKRVN